MAQATLRVHLARSLRRALLLVGLVLIPAVLGVSGPAHASSPPGPCQQGFGTLNQTPNVDQLFIFDLKDTCSFTTSSPQLFVVPGGVTSLDVSIGGAPGEAGQDGKSCGAFNSPENGSVGGTGGFGDLLTGTLSVTPGELLTIVAGATGAEPFHGGTGGRGVFQQPGPCADYGGAGGDGGGASFISNSGDGTFLVVAAGGGGGGGGSDSDPDPTNPKGCGPGAPGGTAGQNGVGPITAYCIDETINPGGGAAGDTADGNGGNGFDADSILVTGGGGGGGGGLHGGDGALGGSLDGGGGGGGGSSLVPEGWTSTAESGVAGVVITYTDTSPPTTTIGLSGSSPNQNQWYTSPVSVDIRASDPDDAEFDAPSSVWETHCELDPFPSPVDFFQLSPSKPCSLSSVTTQGIHTIYAASEDGMGNVENPLKRVTFGIDETPPTTSFIVPSPDGSNGWFITPVTVYAVGGDSLSGVRNTQCAIDPASAPGSYAAIGSGSCNPTVSSDGQHTFYAATEDIAGNTDTVNSASFKVDQTPPTDAPLLSGTLGTNGWYRSDVSVAWNWGDATSGVDSNNCTTGGATTGEGTALTVSGSCKDMAGNLATDSKTFKVDKTPPTISVAALPASPNGSNGWYTTNVTAHFTCDDNLSGVAGCPSDQTLSTEGSSVSSTAETVNDNAGNTSSSSGVITEKIDKTAPSVGVTGVSDGAQYTYGAVPAAGCTTSDSVSGVATQATVSITGGTNGAGSFTATCSGAVDNAGNHAAPVSVDYVVLYAFGGYITPRPDGTIPYKPGTTTQVAFKLKDSQGQEISPSIEASLSGKLTAKLTGQGITPTSASCNWGAQLARFQCSLPIPTLSQTGSSHPYQVTVYENLTGAPVVAPTFSNNPAVANPITVYFQ